MCEDDPCPRGADKLVVLLVGRERLKVGRTNASGHLTVQLDQLLPKRILARAQPRPTMSVHVAGLQKGISVDLGRYLRERKERLARAADAKAKAARDAADKTAKAKERAAKEAALLAARVKQWRSLGARLTKKRRTIYARDNASLCSTPAKPCRDEQVLRLGDKYTMLAKARGYVGVTNGPLTPPIGLDAVDGWIKRSNVMTEKQWDKALAKQRRKQRRAERQKRRAEQARARKQAALARRLGSASAVALLKAGFSGGRAVAVARSLSRYAKYVSRRGVHNPFSAAMIRAAGWDRSAGAESYARATNRLAGGMKPDILRGFLRWVTSGGSLARQTRILLVRRALAACWTRVSPAEAAKLIAAFHSP
ncbi:MAG: hypothetical protein KC503_13565 [Myxococcales bacterium]|nr:hypothetical protein [Myxococcales bacterium]